MSTCKYRSIGLVARFLHAGNDVILSCDVSYTYKICIFEHNNKKCRIDYKNQGGWKFILDCDDFVDRIVPIEQNKKCGIKLQSLTLEDEGTWLCDVDYYNYPSQTYVKGNITLKIIPDSKIEFPITEVEVEKEEVDNNMNTQTNDDSKGWLDGLSRSTMFVIFGIISLIVLTGLIVMFVRNKRKLSSKLKMLEQNKEPAANENNYALSGLNNEEIYEDIDANYENPDKCGYGMGKQNF